MGARPLHGDIAQSQREATLAGYRAGKFNVLVATDVAARGLDITGVELVVQMEPPKDPETYIHRSGRTGRAGMTGVCITMVTRKHEERIPYIEKKAGFKFERIGAPQPSEVATIAAERWGAGRRPPGPPGCCPPLCPPGSLAPPLPPHLTAHTPPLPPPAPPEPSPPPPLPPSCCRAVATVEAVDRSVIPFFQEAARKLLASIEDPEVALALALAKITGHTVMKARSLLTAHEGFTTLMYTGEREVRCRAGAGAGRLAGRLVAAGRLAGWLGRPSARPAGAGGPGLGGKGQEAPKVGGPRTVGASRPSPQSPGPAAPQCNLVGWQGTPGRGAAWSHNRPVRPLGAEGQGWGGVGGGEGRRQPLLAPNPITPPTPPAGPPARHQA
jgi:hypothetical protein